MFKLFTVAAALVATTNAFGGRITPCVSPPPHYRCTFGAKVLPNTNVHPLKFQFEKRDIIEARLMHVRVTSVKDGEDSSYRWFLFLETTYNFPENLNISYLG